MMTPRLRIALAIAQLVVAAILWPKDQGIAIVFIIIAIGILPPHLPRTPSKRQKQKRSTRGLR